MGMLHKSERAGSWRLRAVLRACCQGTADNIWIRELCRYRLCVLFLPQCGLFQTFPVSEVTGTPSIASEPNDAISSAWSITILRQSHVVS